MEIADCNPHSFGFATECLVNSKGSRTIFVGKFSSMDRCYIRRRFIQYVRVIVTIIELTAHEFHPAIGDGLY